MSTNEFWFGLEPIKDLDYICCWGARGTNNYGKIDILPDRQSADKYNGNERFWKVLASFWNTDIKHKVNEMLPKLKNDTRLMIKDEFGEIDYLDEYQFIKDKKIDGIHVYFQYDIKNGKNGYIYIRGYAIDIDKQIAYEKDQRREFLQEKYGDELTLEE